LLVTSSLRWNDCSYLPTNLKKSKE
jgi:hypothetical protein